MDGIPVISAAFLGPNLQLLWPLSLAEIGLLAEPADKMQQTANLVRELTRQDNVRFFGRPLYSALGDGLFSTRSELYRHCHSLQFLIHRKY